MKSKQLLKVCWLKPIKPEVKIDWRVYTKKSRKTFNKRFNY